jgi:hypothetical protein
MARWQPSEAQAVHTFAAVRLHVKRTLEADYGSALMARTSLELRDHRLFKRSTGVIKVEDRVFRAAIKGQADIYVIGRGGWHGEIELKRFTKLTEAQEHWRSWCHAWGVPWLLLEVQRTETPPETIARWMGILSAWLGCTAGSGAAR